MRALLTACTAIACAATQVTWLDSPAPDRTAMPASSGTRPGAAATGLDAARAASAHAASVLVVPAAAANGRI